MWKSIFSFSLLAAALSLVGCKTIDVWDGGYPKSAAELRTSEAKTTEFNKFAIHKSHAAFGGDHGWVQTQKDKDTDKYYSIGSYSSVITHVSPETKEDFATIRNTRNWVYGADLLVLAGAIMMGSTDGRTHGIGNGLFWSGLAGVVGAEMYASSTFEDIKTQYHQDLNREIYGAGKKQGATGGTLGVGWAFKLPN